MRTAGFLVSSLLLLVVPASAAEEVVETAHFRIRAETTAAGAEEIGRVLEAAWDALARDFGRAPRCAQGERYTVRFLATREAWEAAMRADGLEPPAHGGGYYQPSTKTIYVYRQPTVYFTRVLLVHEAVHLFHYLARLNNRSVGPAWYREGIAEHYAWHLWDGERITLAARPPLSLADRAGHALETVSRPGFDLETVVSGRVWPGYSLSFALVRYLATGRDGKPLRGYDTFCRKVEAGGSVRSLFPRIFGPEKRFLPRFRAWLEAAQEPWVWVYNEWDPRGPRSFCGFASVVSCCRVKEPARRLAATMEVPREGPWRGGLLLGFLSKDEYVVALVDAAGGLRVDRRAGGAWQTLATERLPVPPAGGTLALAAARGPEGVTLRVGETTFGPYPACGETLGLALDGARIVFRDLAWE